MKQFLLAVSALIILCGCKEDTKEPTGPTVAPITTPGSSTYYMSFKVDGVSYSYVDGENGYYSTRSSTKTDDTPNDIRYLNLNAGLVSINGLTSGEVGFVHYNCDLTTYDNYKQSALASVTSSGNHGVYIDTAGGKGLHFSFFDNGQIWDTRFGAQTGDASFKVTATIAKANTTGSTLRDVSGTFSGRIYLESTLTYKTVTEGKFKLVYEAP